MKQKNSSGQGTRGIWISTDILRLPNLSPSHKMILGLTEAFGETGLRISNARLAKLLGLSTRQIVRIIRTLRDDGYLADRGPDKWHRVLVVDSDKMSPLTGQTSDKVSLLSSQTSDKVSPKEPKSRDVDVHHKQEEYKQSKKPLQRKKAPPDPRVKEFIDWFCQRYKETFERKYIVSGAKEGAIVKGLLHNLTPEELQAATVNMFSDSWAQDKLSIGLLSSQINKWRTVETPEKRAEREFLSGFPPMKIPTAEEAEALLA